MSRRSNFARARLTTKRRRQRETPVEKFYRLARHRRFVLFNPRRHAK